MKYLSFDIEATGLEDHGLIIEFAMVPFDANSRKIETALQKHFYIKCPSFEQLKPKLNSWVIENNKELITTAHEEGINLLDFKNQMQEYLESSEVKNYFNNQKIVLFGKSLSAIDLPFMNRDLGREWMTKYFHHRNLDLSSFCYGLIDADILPEGMDSGNKLMQYLNMGEVCHTALEDAINTVKMYFKVLDICNNKA